MTLDIQICCLFKRHDYYLTFERRRNAVVVGISILTAAHHDTPSSDFMRTTAFLSM